MTNAVANDDRLWSIQDVSYYLGVPVGTLYQWRCADTSTRGPRGYKVGRYVRYRRSEVEAWLDEQTSGEAA